MVRRAEFNIGSPRATVNPNGTWTVTGIGTYRYDRGHTFKEFRVEVAYAKGADAPVGVTHRFTDETTVAKPGTFSTEFNLRAPKEGEVLTLRAVLVTTNPAGVVEESSSTGTVAVPK